MTLFWMISAGLTVLAMAFVALPLLRKEVTSDVTSDELNLAVFKQQLTELDADLEAGNLDQAQYEAACKDLQKALLTDVPAASEPTQVKTSGRAMAATAILVPVAAFLLYNTLGSPGIISSLAQQPAATSSQHATQPQSDGTKNLPPMEELVKRLAAKMEENPDNIEGWIMLGRSYMSLRDHPAAINAYQRALEMDDQNVNLLLAYSEAIATSNGNNFTGRAAPMIQKAIELDPENPNVLWLAGVLAYQSSDFKTAIAHWNSVRETLPPQSNELESINNAIDDARAKLGLPPEEADLPSIVQAKKPQVQPKSSDAGKAISVEVSLSPELQGKAQPNDLVFIYAKAVSGPPMPLAAVRKKVSDLPISLKLDDSMAMMPQMKLSGFKQVTVGARISKSGGPMAQPGDLEGEIKPVTPGKPGTIQVVINTIHP